MVAVMYEDRPAALTGLKLAVLSLARHSPDLPVIAWVPGAPEPFLRWAAGRDGLSVRTDRTGLTGAGWNVKPSVLLSAFDEGHDEALWFDTDMLVTGDLAARLAQAPPDVLVATQEYYWGHHQGTPRRTTGLGRRVSRVFPSTVNTCLLRVGRAHLDLVREWSRVLASPEYVQAQSLSAQDRPLHFWSDLDVLTGLLGSTEFAHVPVDQLRRGTEIAQCYGPSGFTVRERLRVGSGAPLVIHAMGAKPWAPPAPGAGADGVLGRLRAEVEAVHQDLTPFVAAAAEYADALDEDTSWLTPRTRVGSVVRRALPGHPAWQELPLALVDSGQRAVRRELRLGQIGS